MEVGCRFLRRHDGNVVWEGGIERVRGADGRRTAVHAHARDLPERVNSCIRPARHREAVPAEIRRIQRFSHDPLDGALARLTRPAAEAGPVVLECQLEVHGPD